MALSIGPGMPRQTVKTMTWILHSSWNEPCHEIMVLFVLHKLILQMCMRSHPVGLDAWFLVGPFVYFHTSSVRTAKVAYNWAPSSEFVSSSIPSWQILTAHAQPFRGARDLAFCLKVPLDSLLLWASSEGSGETARMRRLAWTFAARIGCKYQIRLTRSNYYKYHNLMSWLNCVWPSVAKFHPVW